MPRAAANKRKPETFTRVVEEPDNDDFEHVEDDAELLSDNSVDVPLFADSDKRTLRSIAYLRVFRMEGGGMTYKGQVPISTSMESLGQQFGDGVYTIEACNVKHQLRNRSENIRISLSPNGSQAQSAAPLMIDRSAEIERTERLTMQASKDSMRLSEAFTTMVLTQSREAAERERAFMQSILSQQTLGFQQMMTLLQTGHTHTLARLETVNANSKQTDPMAMVAMMMKAMEMGRDWASGGDDDDEDEDLPPWERAAKVLTDGAGLLVGVAKKQLSGQEAPADKNAKKMTPEQVQLVREAMAVAQAVRSSGLTMSQVLEKLKTPAVSEQSAETAPQTADLGADASQSDDDDFEENEASADDNDENEPESDSDGFEESAGVGESD